MNARAGIRPNLSCPACKRGGAAIAGLLCATSLALAAPAAHAAGATATADPSSTSRATIRYVVVIAGKPGTKRGSATAAAALGRARHGGINPARVYRHAINGFAADLTIDQVARLRRDADVSLIAADKPVRAASVHQLQAPWNLDRLDQMSLPLSGGYRYTNTGAGVKAYVIDSGIRISHAQFGGRASYGANFVAGATSADDCNGHGTHVAGTIGGSTYGVAKGVSLVAVRVLNCSGLGAFSDVIAGVDWVTAQHLPGQPAVANMSISGAAYAPLDNALANSIADGVTYTVPAGDFGVDACGYSPSRVADALTVGATTRTDARAGYSNIGTCLDLFAPGHEVTSAWIGSDTATSEQSGTSMAAPHVAGAAAMYLQSDPTALPATVGQWLRDNATSGKVTNAGAGSPNRLLNIVQEDDQKTTVARRPNGKIDLLTRSADGNAAVATLDKTGRLIMAWRSLEKQVRGAPSGVWTRDGENLDIFVVGTDSRVYRRRYNSSNGWGAWGDPLDPANGVSTSNTVNATRNSAGITVFMRGLGGIAKMLRISSSERLVHGWKNVGNRPDRVVAGAPTGSWTAEDRLNVFAVTPDHQLWAIRDGGGTWGDWRVFHPGWHSETVGIGDRGDVLDVFARVADDAAVRYCATVFAVYCGAELLGKSVTSAPHGCWSPDAATRIVVARGDDGLLDRRRWTQASGWENWTNSPVSSASVGAANGITTPSADVMQLLSVGNDQGGYQTGLRLDGTTALPWTSIGLGHRMTDAPSGTWNAAGSLLDVVAISDEHKLYRREFNRTGTGGSWALLPGDAPSASGSASVTGYADGVSPVIRGRDGQVYFQTIDRSGAIITPWSRLGGPILGSPAASWNRGGNVLDVFIVGIDRRVYRRQYRRGIGWTPGWIVVPGDGRTDDGVFVARRPNDAVSVFIRSSTTRAALMTELSPSGAATPWLNLGNKLLGTPSAYWSVDGATLDVFGVGDDYKVTRLRGTVGGPWSAWQPQTAYGAAPPLAPPASVQGPPPALTEEDDTSVPIGAAKASGSVRQSDAAAVPAVAARQGDPPPPPSGTLPPL